MMSENQNEQYKKALALRYPPNGGGEEKFSQGMDILSKLAEEGYAPAQYDLGMELLLPRMGASNFKDAYIWFQRAADQNYSEACRQSSNTTEFKA